jgi:hypothetical protein
MKKVRNVTLAMFAVAAISFAADNTLGSWKYNTAKSKQAAGVSPIKSLVVMREAAGGGSKITAKGERADGTKIDTVTTTKYDGKPAQVTGSGLAWDTTSIKQTGPNALTEERAKTGGKYHSTVKTVVSKDGKTMTATTKGTGADGKPFTSMAVFDKQ